MAEKLVVITFQIVIKNVIADTLQNSSAYCYISKIIKTISLYTYCTVYNVHVAYRSLNETIFFKGSVNRDFISPIFSTIICTWVSEEA